jgi:hypothetical protein
VVVVVVVVVVFVVVIGGGGWVALSLMLSPTRRRYNLTDSWVLLLHS